ncbi:DUF6036 family nucleotidyltransferase [Anaerolineales bacterium HSG6]|nr:DUF6036 family nucleotidyltransferase [Anaerolineales bacterium HSG6]
MSLSKQKIITYLQKLNEELTKINTKGEICLYGGAVMCLVYNARPSTKDVDAIFQPTQALREAIKQVAISENLRDDWLNDAVKGFVVNHSQRVFLDLSHLMVYVPEPDYLLAMKTLAARVDGTDKGDVEFLINYLGLQTPAEVFTIIENYYPRQRIKPVTQYFVEELFEHDDPV